MSILRSWSLLRYMLLLGEERSEPEENGTAQYTEAHEVDAVDAVGVEVGVVMLMVVFLFVAVLGKIRHTLCPLYYSKVYYTTAATPAQAPEGDILTKINVLTQGLFGTII